MTTLSSTQFSYIIVPTAYMREKPDHNSEVVSQAYFSECVHIIEEVGSWIKISTSIDSYLGWVEKNVVQCRITAFPSNKAAKVNRIAAHLYNEADTTHGPQLTLPFESKLEVIDASQERWIKVSLPDECEGFIQRGVISFDSKQLNREEMCLLSKKFLGLPYTWGGRSSFGYDCSGFTQMLYRQMGVYIPRDAKDQMQWNGFIPADLEKLNSGDLIFFGLDEAKIRHVAMCLENDLFIHSTVAENNPDIHFNRLSDPEWNGSGRFKFRAARTLSIVTN